MFLLISATTGCTNKNKENPISGNWTSPEEGVGYFEFTDDSFKWFQSQDNLDDNYYYGTYTYVAGALRNNGKYDYGEKGSEIYTLTMNYEGVKIDGEFSETESDGAFTIQRIDSKDSLYILNHRTGGRFVIDRLN
jgi:hypothetical protein